MTSHQEKKTVHPFHNVQFEKKGKSKEKEKTNWMSSPGLETGSLVHCDNTLTIRLWQSTVTSKVKFYYFDMRVCWKIHLKPAHQL